MSTTIHSTKIYDKAPEVWNALIFSLISIAFLLSDWVILHSSFGDFILVFVAFLFLILGQIKFNKKQLSVALIPLFFMFLNYILNENFNDYWFDTTRAMLSYMKILLYVTVVLLVYSLVKRYKLINRFLQISNLFALAAIGIGIIITLMIYAGREDLTNIIWTYTRTDTLSYYFNENPSIIRTRSLFSEPAHLGYYLNTVFFANVFSEKKNNYIVLSILAVGILLTLSYGMIIIFLATGATYVIGRMIKGDFEWSNWYLSILIPLGLLIIYFWEFINISVIQRTVAIFTGADGSAYNRIFESWIYIANERIIFGNGIAHSPPITNIYAYLLTDFGLVGLIPYVFFSLYLLLVNVAGFVFFVMMNSAKGGYLNPAFWLFILYFFLFAVRPYLSTSKENVKHSLYTQ